MNKEVLFFDYAGCFNYYVKQIDKIRQAKIKGEVILAKPALLVSIIDALDEDIFIHNEFFINEWLEERYKSVISKFAHSSQFSTKTSIDKPFWHLESDGFWYLNCPGEHFDKKGTPSKSWLKENVLYASFDESLWILLQNKIWRQSLRDYIVEHKLAGGSWANKVKLSAISLLTTIILSA